MSYLKTNIKLTCCATVALLSLVGFASLAEAARPIAADVALKNTKVLCTDTVGIIDDPSMFAYAGNTGLDSLFGSAPSNQVSSCGGGPIANFTNPTGEPGAACTANNPDNTNGNCRAIAESACAAQMGNPPRSQCATIKLPQQCNNAGCNGLTITCTNGKPVSQGSCTAPGWGTPPNPQ